MGSDQISIKIARELEHIDWGERRSPQALFRMLYSTMRKKQLEGQPQSDAGITLLKALARTQREYPYFVAAFDAAFFGLAPDRVSAGLGGTPSSRFREHALADRVGAAP